MELVKMPEPYQLIHGLSEFLFKSSEIKCVVLISKNPYLSALIACHGAKISNNPPYTPGSCMLLPLNEPHIYKHVVIERLEEFNGQLLYFFKFRKKHSCRNKKITTIENDIGLGGKGRSFVEKQGILFPFKSEGEWLGKHDVDRSELETISSEVFPTIIGQKHLVEYWKNKALNLKQNPDYTMADILNVSKDVTKFDRLNIFSKQNEKAVRNVNQIWVNSVPESMSSGKYLIILSPAHNFFEEKILEVNQIYSDLKLSTVKEHEIPQRLFDLGISNRSLSVVALLKEELK
ncbi:MAG: hypothetical protein V7771_08205 [Shewanella psychromarinicola]|uniref:hypothetical protein n=1 Tax=Shewanella psychromarinicola TaxID=2487742 RepID=UPI00300125CE